MTSETLTVISAAVLSLLFSYTPGLSGKWGNLMPEFKRLIMLVLLLLVAGVVFSLACSGWGADFGLAVTCDKTGGIGLVRALVLAVMANQSTYAITPKK